ncbi:hypothetical protein MPLDJ20_110257 [Mesorhizobium plurifarium]|uniref:Uncharacterized protein n=1 Tax=Mesorhizobium plurifarium TaxID=69974 RepID=A0A090DXQ5_MESPL|nr:hypothetical protein MPLDJ20_110257 [Mesorhizobium plurifarium]
MRFFPVNRAGYQSDLIFRSVAFRSQIGQPLPIPAGLCDLLHLALAASSAKIPGPAYCRM